MPQPAHAQNFREAAAGVLASAVASAARAALVELPGGGVAVGAGAPGGEALGSALLPPPARLAPATTVAAASAAGCGGPLLPAPASLPATAAAAHAEHFRAAAGFFFCVLVNEPGGVSVAHAAHRMASAREAGQDGGGATGWCLCAFLIVVVACRDATHATRHVAL